MSCQLRFSDRLRVSCRLLLVGSVFLGGAAFAQEPEAEPPADPKEAAAKAAADAEAAEELKRAQAEALAELLKDTAELSPQQVANFQKWIPHTFGRLSERQEVHIVAIGDSVTRYISYDENRENTHYAFHGVFAAKLADEFFYTGAVRDINPTRENAPKLDELLGPEITIENLGMNGRCALHALSRITTDGLVNKPDLVIINFGINDAISKIDLASFIEALDRSVKLIRSTRADVMLLGPSQGHHNADPAEVAMTRVYSGAIEELAARHGIFYFDLGDVTNAVGGIAEGATPQQFYDSYVRRLDRTYFNHGAEIEDYLHPDPNAHQLMGRAVFKALRDGPTDPPYRFKGFFVLEGAGKATLEFKMKNMGESSAEGKIVLLPTAGMEAQSPHLSFNLAPGKAQVFRVPYSTGSGAINFPAEAPRLFLPLIVGDKERTYMPVFPAAVTPVGVVWDTGLRDLPERAFSVKPELVATSAEPVAGTYVATWNGQTVSGSFDVQAGERWPLDLEFRVPAEGTKFSVFDDLVLSLRTSSGKQLKFVRHLEASRNLGLGEAVDMIHPQDHQGDPRVRFIAEADLDRLVLNFDVDGIPLEGGGDTIPLVMEFQLDARSYGKRRKFGFVDFVRVKIGLDGKPLRVSALRPAVFGDWYNRPLDSSKIGFERSALAGGIERYSITIPRELLYRHEFALGKANSIIGINAELFFAKDGNPDRPYPEDRHFKVVHSLLNRHDAESLTALELAAPSTGRWSIRLD